MTALVIDFNLTEQDFQYIVDTAGYVIGYWASEAQVYPSKYVVWEAEEHEAYELCPVHIEQAMIAIANGTADVARRIRNKITDFILNKKYDVIDSESADVIIQVAAFGEIVYG